TARPRPAPTRRTRAGRSQPTWLAAAVVRMARPAKALIRRRARERLRPVDRAGRRLRAALPRSRLLHQEEGDERSGSMSNKVPSCTGRACARSTAGYDPHAGLDTAESPAAGSPLEPAAWCTRPDDHQLKRRVSLTNETRSDPVGRARGDTAATLDGIVSIPWRASTRAKKRR